MLAVPCHLWVSVSSAERQIERIVLAGLCLWKEGPRGTCFWDTQNVAGARAPEHLSPQPAGSQPGVTLPLGSFGCVWRHPDCRDRGCYWHLMGGGQRCYSASCSAQAIAPTTKNYQAPLRQLCLADGDALEIICYPWHLKGLGLEMLLFILEIRVAPRL